MFSKTPARLVCGAAAVLTALGVAGLTASPASAATAENKPWKHTITVETTNVQVQQHNWVRANAHRSEGYRSAQYSYSNGDGDSVERNTGFAENTGGSFQVREHDRLVDGTSTTSSTARYDGYVNVAAEFDMTVNGPGSTFPQDYPAADRHYDVFYLGPNQTTGWRHIEVVGAGGDFVKMDYRVTNQASPQG